MEANHQHPPHDHPHLEAAKKKIGPNESFQVEEHNPIELRVFLYQQWTKATQTGWSFTRSNSPNDGQLVQDEICNRWFDRLWDLHTQTSRHYHTIVHVWEMLSWVEALEHDDLLSTSTLSSTPAATTLSSSALRLATFFHDAIYDPTSQKNERNSAELWDEFCKSQESRAWSVERNLDVDLPRMVRTMILATEHHQIVIDDSHMANDDTTPLVDFHHLQAIFLDIDMAVLGKSRPAYFAYAALIRQEYQHVPSNIYCEKRAEILQSFCRLPRTIYLSPVFQQILEVTAKENLLAEIELLNQGFIPGEVGDGGNR